jgi:hypothetical protein
VNTVYKQRNLIAGIGNIIDLVEKIMNKKGVATSELEKEIDRLVYKLYDLTYEEVKIIDPEFPLTEQDYQAITIESTP